MEAKIINKTELTLKDIINGNFLVHRVLSVIYSLMFVYFVFYTYVNLEALLLNFTALALGITLLILSAWIGFLWPIIRGFLWLFKLKRNYHTNTMKLTISFYDLYCKVDNETMNATYKLQYKDIYKTVETKQVLEFVFGRSNYVYIKKAAFNKATDLDKVKAYIARLNK